MSGDRRSNIWEAVDALNARHTREQARGVVVLQAAQLPDPDFGAFMRRMSSALACSRDDSLAAQYWLTLGDLATAAPAAMQPWMEPLATLALQHLKVTDGYDACKAGKGRGWVKGLGTPCSRYACHTECIPARPPPPLARAMSTS
jgi:hypothetical protein